MWLLVACTSLAAVLLGGSAVLRGRSVRGVLFGALFFCIDRVYRVVLLLRLFVLLRQAESRKWEDGGGERQVCARAARGRPRDGGGEDADDGYGGGVSASNDVCDVRL